MDIYLASEQASAGKTDIKFMADNKVEPYLTWAFLEPSPLGGGAPHHNFVVCPPMIMKIGTFMELN